MAQTVLVNPFISLNGSDVSTSFKSITLAPTVNLVESTSFGDEWITRIAGTKDWSLTMDFNQDYAAAAIDSALWALFAVSVAMIIRPTASGVSTSNPQYIGAVILSDYPILAGSVGDLIEGSATFAADGALTRATS